MRIRKALTYAVLTALVFPLALLASFYILYTLSDERWYRGDEVKISSQAAIRLAKDACWQSNPELQDPHAHWSTHLTKDLKWVVTLGWGGWYRLGMVDRHAYALVDANKGYVLECQYF